MKGAGKDTIAALASAAGRAGVAVVRVSGSTAPDIARAMLGALPPPRRAVMRSFADANGQPIDQGLALYFPAPASFTGEHVLELQGHGSPMLVDMLLARLLELGARMAEPGEFSRRAFLNDKLSLDQAEAIADAIDAGSAAVARAAVRSMQGVFARQVAKLVDEVLALRVYTEAAIDFPDEEDVDFLGDGQILARLEALQDAVAELLASAAQGAVFRDGLRIVILGAPNVGKSSLLNRLAQRETAIVTEIAGTTRDVLSEQLTVDGLPLTLIDTAGLRDTLDPIEAEGVRRAHAEIERADHVLLVVDDRDALTEDAQRLLNELSGRVPVTVLANKIDLSGNAAGACLIAGRAAIRISATAGAGFAALARALREAAGAAPEGEPEFAARRRHVDALQRSAAALATGRLRLVEDAAGDLLAEELRLAQMCLGEITGQFSSDDLLGAIFSSFCIGK